MSAKRLSARAGTFTSLPCCSASPDSALIQAPVTESPLALPPEWHGRAHMPALLFTCPATRHRASTGIETTVQSLRECWKATVRVDCPHCGQQHEISVRETYVDAALDDAAAGLRGFV